MKIIYLKHLVLSLALIGALGSVQAMQKPLLRAQTRRPAELMCQRTLENQKYGVDDVSHWLLGLVIGKTATPEKVRELIAAGARRNVREISGGNTPLHLAILEDLDQEVLSALLEDGPDLNCLGITVADLINAGDTYGASSLHRAKRIPTLAFLLALGGDINVQDAEGYGPLHSALWHKNTNKMHFLLHCGASQALTTQTDQTPIEISQDENLKEAFRTCSAELQTEIESLITSQIVLRRMIPHSADLRKLLAAYVLKALIERKLTLFSLAHDHPVGSVMQRYLIAARKAALLNRIPHVHLVEDTDKKE